MEELGIKLAKFLNNGGLSTMLIILGIVLIVYTYNKTTCYAGVSPVSFSFK